MPPAGSPWSVVITAAAAFFGVVIAQIWTTWRDNRNWQHQRDMYALQSADQRRQYAEQREDQRERDSEQREEQRRKDRELWDREDRNRFIELRREKYADLLSGMANAQSKMIIAAIERTGRFGEDDATGRKHQDRLARSINDARDAIRELSRTMSPVELFAPRNVTQLIDQYMSMQMSNLQEIEEGREPSIPVNYDDRIRTAMRADLTGEVEDS